MLDVFLRFQNDTAAALLPSQALVLAADIGKEGLHLLHRVGGVAVKFKGPGCIKEGLWVNAALLRDAVEGLHEVLIKTAQSGSIQFTLRQKLVQPAEQLGLRLCAEALAQQPGDLAAVESAGSSPSSGGSALATADLHQALPGDVVSMSSGQPFTGFRQVPHQNVRKKVDCCLAVKVQAEGAAQVFKLLGGAAGIRCFAAPNHAAVILLRQLGQHRLAIAVGEQLLHHVLHGIKEGITVPAVLSVPAQDADLCQADFVLESRQMAGAHHIPVGGLLAADQPGLQSHVLHQFLALLQRISGRSSLLADPLAALLNRLADHPQHFAVRGRLDNIVGHIQRDGLPRILEVGVGSEQYAADRHFLLAHPADEGQAVLHRHLDVAEHDVHCVLLQDSAGLQCIERHKHLRKALSLPVNAKTQPLCHIDLIIHDQQFHLVSSPLSQPV